MATQLHQTTEFCTAQTLVDLVDADCAAMGARENAEDIPWTEDTSDHAIVAATIGAFRIASWNVASDAWAAYFRPAIDPATGEDMSQRLSRQPFATPSEARHMTQARRILQMVTDGVIVCLQEASSQLVDFIGAASVALNIPTPVMIITNRSESGADDFHVTIWDPNLYEISLEVDHHPPSCDMVHGNSIVVLKAVAAGGSSISFANVHVDFKGNEKLADRAISLVDQLGHDVYFVGDFNVSCRSATVNLRADHITAHYSGRRFSFAVPSPGSAITGVNAFRNTGSTALMLDRLDHIMRVAYI
jgi:endonuclease/exonuclease/phosphatase family metal-dependent hydrolase